MTKSELVAKVAERAGVTKKDADAVLSAFTEVMIESVNEGDKTTVPGFGTFELVEKAARTGINPVTKEKIQIKASRNMKFRPSKAVKDALLK